MKIFKLITILSFVCLSFFIACKDEPTTEPDAKNLATVTTQAALAQGDSATLNGSVTNDGNSSITKRGFCWAYSPLPTIASNITSDGTGIGAFSHKLKFTDAGTVYVRAYAINETGAAYGNEISFATTGLTIAPLNYTQKGALEFSMCASGANCPDAQVVLSQLISKYGANKIFPVGFHNTKDGADGMQNNISIGFTSVYWSSNPCGFINRQPSTGGKGEDRTLWDAGAAKVLAGKAVCGLAIDATKKVGSVYTIKIKSGIGATDLNPGTGEYTVIVYVVEKELSGKGSGWDQANAFNTISGHKYYQAGNPIKDFVHEYVFTSALTIPNGDPIPVDKIKARTIGEKTFTLDMTGKDDSDTYIVACFFDRTFTKQFSIYNAQMVKLGANQPFD